MAGAVLGRPFGVSPLGKLPLTHRAYKPQGLSQTTNREGAQPHPSVDNWIEVLLSTALPTRARLSFPTTSPSHQEAYTSLLASFTRGQTVEARIITIPQQLETKPHHRKLTRMKKQRVLSHMKGQGKTPEKQMNKVVMGNLPEKEFRIMIVEMI